MDTSSQGISCQPRYIQTVTGVLKLIELLCDLLALILGAAAPTLDGYSGNKGFFLFVAILSFIITLILFGLIILNIQNVYLRNHWFLIEIIWCGFIALFYFIASIVVATIAKYSGVYGGAAFFGFAAFIVYIADGIYQFRMRRINSFNQQQQQQYAPSMAQQQQYAPSMAQQQQYPPNMPPQSRPQGNY